MSHFAQLFLRFAVLKLSPETFQLEQTGGGKSHNASIDEEESMEEERTYAMLSFFMVSEMTGVIAVVRYTSPGCVSEHQYQETPEDYCRLQEEVDGALMLGIDVSVMTNHDPEEFPQLYSYLVEA